MPAPRTKDQRNAPPVTAEPAEADGPLLETEQELVARVERERLEEERLALAATGETEEQMRAAEVAAAASTAGEPMSAAARAAAGLGELNADGSGVSGGEGEPVIRRARPRRIAPQQEWIDDDGPELVDEPYQPEPAVRAHASRAIATGPGGEELHLSQDEMQALRHYRRTRGEEIRENIDAAPQRVGTDLNPYTLVHLRGCPDPDRTEIYDVQNTSSLQMFTVHRCVECGAHQAIPH